MRKRRRLVNKIITMSCAVMVAVSAFFYAPMEVSAKTVWQSNWVNWGGSNQVDYYITGVTDYVSSDVHMRVSYAPDGSKHTVYDVTPGSTYNEYVLDFSLPLSDWGTPDPGLTCDVLGLKFYADIAPGFDLEIPDFGYQTTDLDINLTSAELIVQGKSYECIVDLMDDGWYRIFFFSVVDTPNEGFPFYGGLVTLRLKGNYSFYIHTSHVYDKNDDLTTAFVTPDAVIRIGGQGGPFKLQYRPGTVSDDAVSAIENQTNNLNQATQNQTSELTNGFDNSKGDTVNSDLSAGLNEFQTAEDSLFSTASSSLSDYQFFNLASVPAMVTGMSFVSSIMGSWFNQAGGASGVGIVLSILFSIMLVAMVLGLYRWYQSKGGKD